MHNRAPPRQHDPSSGEFLILRLAPYVAGVNSTNASWGRLFAIALQPFGADFPSLILSLKYININHFGAIGRIAVLDDGALIRLPRLNIAC